MCARWHVDLAAIRRLVKLERVAQGGRRVGVEVVVGFVLR